MPREKLSRNFYLDEFACKCGCGHERRPEIRANLAHLCFDALEPLRIECGNKPMTVTSGARCEAYNARVGGAKASQHPKGRAADVVVDDMPPAQVQEKAKRIPAIGGIGLGKTFTHVDTRPRRVVFRY